MEIDDSVFSFEDFLANKIEKRVTPKQNDKGVFESNNISENEESHLDDGIENNSDLNLEEDIIEESEIVDTKQKNETENFYPLYKDKSENFSCDIHVEGAKTDETITRLIVETEDWTLMFPGEIKNGKVNIPIRKLNIFNEGQIGKIKLEVIAEGTIFIPWEDDFKIKLSKKVSVSLNENRKVSQNKDRGVGVKVKVRR